MKLHVLLSFAILTLVEFLVGCSGSRRSTLSEGETHSSIMFYSPERAPETLEIRYAHDPSDSIAKITKGVKIILVDRGMLSEGFDLVAISRNDDSNGHSVQIQQTYYGLRVEGGTVTAMFDKENELIAINQALVKNLDFGVKPSLLEEQAFQKASNKIVSFLASKGIPVPNFISHAELIIANHFGPGYQLCWRFTFPHVLYRIDVVAAGPDAGKAYAPRGIGASASLAKVKIYNGSLIPLIPVQEAKGILVLNDGVETEDAKTARLFGKELVTEDASAAAKSMKKILKFYKTMFGRDSFDGKGASVELSSDIASPFAIGNAYWDPEHKLFAFGAPDDVMGHDTACLDVVGHEFTHAVVSYSSNLEYFAESGALNEHLADVMGIIFEQKFDPQPKPFLLGDKSILDPSEAEALRDMEHPEKGLQPQPATVAEIEEHYKNKCAGHEDSASDACGVHNLSGIPNRAAVDIIKALGWNKSATLYYRVMTQRLRPTSDFQDYAYQVIDECHFLGYGEELCGKVNTAIRNAIPVIQ